MAEATALRNNALPYPVYGVAFTVVAPLLDADGDPISPSSPDSEVSKNGDTFADCTNEATEIATSSGVVYLTLTSTEMTADIVAARIQSTGAKTTILTLYPRKLPILATGTCQGSNDTGDIQLASGDSAIDDYYNGCLCVAVIDGTTEARIINDYVGSTKVGEVSPAWNTAQPDNNDTYTIYLPEGRQVQQANTTHVNGTAQTARDLGANAGSGGSPDALYIRKNGATSNILRVKLRRADTSQGLTGLAFNTSGLKIATITDNESASTTYTSGGSTIETVSGAIGTYAAPTATKCRFVEISSADQPGVYEIHLADARFAVSGAKTLRIAITGVANLRESEILVQLTAFDLDTASVAQTGDSYVIVNSATHGNSALLGQIRLRTACKTYYVNSSTGNDINSGSYESPLLTRAAAAALMKAGDTMHCTGTFTGTYTNSMDGITIEGDGHSGTLFTNTATSTTTFTNSGNYFTLRNLKVTNTVANGASIQDGNTKGCTYDNVYGDSDLDGFLSSGSTNLKVIGGTFVGKFDGLTFQNSTFEAIRPTILCDGTNGAGTECRAIYITNASAGRLISPKVTFTRTNATTSVGHTFGIGIEASAVEIIDPYILITMLNGSAQGKVIGIGVPNDPTHSHIITVTNPLITLVNTGSGATWDLDPGTASTNRVTLFGGNTDSTKWSDTTKVFRADDALQPSVVGRKADVDGSGTVLDRNSTTIDTKIGTPATDLASVIDTNLDAKVSEVEGGGGTPVSPFNVDRDHTWSFSSPNQSTAPNILSENIGFDGILAMDFTEPIPALTSISSVSAATFANITGTEPTVSDTAVSADKKKAHITIDASAATANTYTLSVTVVTTDSQTFVRKGRVTIS